MAKLNVKKLTESAEECLGWPYVSPGSNNKSGIDCSGLFVKMYRDQGASIYHGSNTIFREYCSETEELKSAKQLREGMAVFKRKAWKDADKGNRWYGKDPGNLSHIGYVAGVNPLRIIHASTGTMCVTTDSKIGTWAWCGKLKDADYGGSAGAATPGDDDKDTQEDEGMYTAILEGGNPDKPINIRVKPDGDLQDQLPQGSIVSVIDESGNWCRIAYTKGKKAVTGYVKGEYVCVADEDQIPEDKTGGGSEENETVTLTFSVTAKEAAEALPLLEKLTGAIAGKIGRG